ncbi:hypothetical protein CAPTEDRAFT_207566 [Capitella teleta]|uniref:Uncharacterized protein n=1 Tax=Capitella teleta TaxID=283909 RepID=R7VEX3_CAPTE|nr:hypothetical protein CAPTEDRAFT_207566 [Capitella teleta]|eukprot:ELU14856.1 hypothetical protein CAPTEDRAFT_207566 [Capitella teleta]
MAKVYLFFFFSFFLRGGGGLAPNSPNEETGCRERPRLNQQEKENIELKERLNNLEQCSRRAHLRIRGLKVEKGKDCKEVVASFLSSKLKRKNGFALSVKREDIDAAHPLRPLKFTPRGQSTPVSRKIPFERAARPLHAICTDDLTIDNVKLLKSLKSCAKVDSSWSTNGKIYIYAKLKEEDRGRVFNIYDNIPQ